MSAQPRTPGLAELLGEHLAHSQGLAFSWGQANCCHFAARWVERATGANPMQGLPATASAAAAVRLVRALGGTLQAAWTLQLRRQPVPAAMAQLGDVVLLPMPDDMRGRGPGHATGQAVGVCVGSQAVVMTAEGFHAYLPMRMAVCAWPLRERA